MLSSVSLGNWDMKDLAFQRLSGKVVKGYVDTKLCFEINYLIVWVLLHRMKQWEHLDLIAHSIILLLVNAKPAEVKC